MPDSPKPGFYGKVPVLGDFVSRRLPRYFIQHWDNWLQSAVDSSREQLGAGWLDLYLNSPIWRFGLSPGLVGREAWAGILMPSVDKVGRYFPLMVAVPVDQEGAFPMLFDTARAWFEAVEQLALTALDDGFDLERFDAALQQLMIKPRTLIETVGQRNEPAGDPRKWALQVSFDSSVDLPLAFAAASASLLDRFLPHHSVWYAGASETLRACLLLCEGLPAIDAYASLLNGDWRERGWNMSAWKLSVAVPASSAGADASSSVGSGEAVPWRSHGITEVGRKRRINEDAFIARPEVGLWAVADGMGGHRAGDVASAAVVDKLAKLSVPAGLDETTEQVKRAIGEANDQLRTISESTYGGSIVGTTIVVLLAKGEAGRVLWAGDSRLYRYREGRLEQLTKDHSVAEEFWDEEDFFRPARNVITRAVGADPSVLLDAKDIEIRDGDLYLLCTDGLDKEVSGDAIAEILRLAGENCVAGAQALIRAAVERGARDNVTVVVVRCQPPRAKM